MELVYLIALKSMSRSVHHKVAVEALQLIDSNWRKLFLKKVQKYLEGSKAPDKKFHDFMNHVYHVHQQWGGAPKSVEKWYSELVKQLKDKNWDNAVYAAGVLSHYYADVSHPFHTAQTKAEARIHSYTEFGGAEIFQKKIHPNLKLQLYNVDNVKDFTIKLANKSFDYYTEFLEEFDTTKAANYKWGKAYNQQLVEITTELLSEAISGYASLLQKAILEAQVEPPRTSLFLKSFVEILKIPIYWILRKLDKAEKKRITKAIETEYKATGKVYDSLSDDDRTIVKEYDKAKKQHPDWIDHPKLAIKERKVTEKAQETTPEKTPTKATKKTKKTETKEKAPRYYLNIDDEVDKAPEIGKKTAERLKKVGIITVKDLINADPSEIAKKLNVRYIKPKTIERWQIQAKLNTQIAETRGHDVRIMCELGIRDAGDLAKFTVEELLEKATKVAQELGDRVVSEGSMPTKEEVAKWKKYAEQK